MVSPSSILCSLATVIVLSISPALAKDYQLGEKAEADIITPVALDVIDAQATADLKKRQSQRVPVIYRFDPHAIDEVEAAFHSTFARTRTNFSEMLQARFHVKTIDPDAITSNDYERFLNQFQKQNIFLPVRPELSRIWAKGESDQELEAALLARLRAAMKLYVRPDSGPKDIWIGSSIRLVSMADDEPATARLVNERGFTMSKTNFVALQRAKTELMDSFSAEERSLAKYVASFLKPNCTMEADLTRQLRAEHTAGLFSAAHYNAGQIVVQRGQVIDQKAQAALQQLKEKTAVKELQQLKATVTQAPAEVKKNFSAIWILVSGGGAFVLGCVVVWKLARRRTPVSLLPATISKGLIEAGNTNPHGSEEAWQERALLAEQRSEKVQAAVRSGFMAQFARWMSEKMTQKLISQRQQLLDAHQTAAIEMAELEARLEKVQAPLEQRLRAYERRIVDLEKELSIKGEENRELIKAKIHMIRKQLEIEREKNRLEFN
ncbi:MAG: hypothetical protein ACTHLW_15500 [Verrucomicrobiota bacterium]